MKSFRHDRCIGRVGWHNEGLQGADIRSFAPTLLRQDDGRNPDCTVTPTVLLNPPPPFERRNLRQLTDHEACNHLSVASERLPRPMPGQPTDKPPLRDF